MLHICPECGQLYEGTGLCPQDQTPLRPQDDPLLGQDVGHYRITRLLGVGGMGRVYKAVQPSIGARVAVKVLAAELAQNQELIDRFFAEARSVNFIRHEHIINILDLERFPDGRPYIIMEYVDGAPLASVIQQRGTLPLGSLAQLMAEVLDALGAAHARNIVHRDLKPDNIFVTPAGHAKVLDFGIAKLDPGLGGGNQATRAGSIMGTPPYMSPEQAMAKAVDARSDLYAVGIMLYECVTGRVPFTAESLFEILRMHLEQPPQPPRTIRADLPPAFEAVIMRALEKDVALRFQTAQEMAAALVQATQGLPPEAWATLRTTEGMSAAMPAQVTPFASRAGGISVPPTQVRPAGKSSKGLVLGLVGALAVAGIVTAVVLTQKKSATATAAGGGASPPVAAGSSSGAATQSPQVLNNSATPPPAAGGSSSSAAAPPTATSAPAFPAELHSGIPECDTFLMNWYACIGKMPETYRKQMYDGIKQAAGAYKQSAGGGDAVRKALGDSCKQASDSTRKGMASFGCAWDLKADGASSSGGAEAPAGGAEGSDDPSDDDAPPKVDVKDFDAVAFLPEARKLAAKEIPDPELTDLFVMNAKSDGRSDLTLTANAIVTYKFRSKAASERGDKPEGVELKCLTNVYVTTSMGLRVEPRSDEKCQERIIGDPKCTVGDIVKRAQAGGAPRNAIAMVHFLTSMNDEVRWMYSVGSSGDHMMTFKDDCK